MIRRVRRQFICITMAMLTTVLLIPLIALNVITEAMSYNQTRNLLEQIAISETAVRQMPDGAPPDGKQPQETTDAVPAAGSDTSTETTVTTTASTTTTAETTIVQTERAPAETKAAGSGAPAPAAVQTQPPTPRQTAAPRATTAVPRATTARQTKAPVTTTKAVVSREQSPQQHSRLSLIPLVRQSRICRRIRRRGGAGTIRLMTTRTTGKITPPGSRCSTPCRWQVWHSLCP